MFNIFPRRLGWYIPGLSRLLTGTLPPSIACGTLQLFFISSFTFLVVVRGIIPCSSGAQLGPSAQQRSAVQCHAILCGAACLAELRTYSSIIIPGPSRKVGSVHQLSSAQQRYVGRQRSAMRCRAVPYPAVRCSTVRCRAARFAALALAYMSGIIRSVAAGIGTTDTPDLYVLHC